MQLLELASEEIWTNWGFPKGRWIQEVETVCGVNFPGGRLTGEPDDKNSRRQVMQGVERP